MTNNKEVAVEQRNNSLPVTSSNGKENAVAPFADIYEAPDAFVLVLDMPGAAKESISVITQGDSLTVRGDASPYHKENATLLFRELHNANYRRIFTIGKGIDPNRIDAQFEHGVLSIRLFKRERAKPREIQIM